MILPAGEGRQSFNGGLKMTRRNAAHWIAAGFLTASAAVLGAPGDSAAQTGRCCMGDCSPKPYGVVTDVYLDEVPAFSCGGGEQVLQGSELKGLVVMELSNGKFFLPTLGVAVEAYDVETSFKPDVAVKCQDAAGNLGAGNTKGTMGAGRCQ